MVGKKAESDRLKSLPLRITLDELAALDAAATAAGLSKPQYIRKCVQHWSAATEGANPIRADLDAELEAKRARERIEQVSYAFTDAERKEWELAAGEHGLNAYVHHCLTRWLDLVGAGSGSDPGG